MTEQPLNVVLRAMLDRLDLNQAQGAAYLGVSKQAFGTWLSGQRTPTPAVRRLVDILAMLEVVSPDLHAHLMPVRAQRGPPTKAQQTP